VAQAAKRKILVVDDNTNFLDLIGLVFDEEFTILRGENGEDGMALARKELPDVILLDVMMPKVSGLEMLRELQSDTDTRALPVIVLTASNFDPTTMAMFQREVNVKAFLKKPCAIDKLRSEITRVLEKSSLGA
jgi:CheY-like chemotaxis protein